MVAEMMAFNDSERTIFQRIMDGVKDTHKKLYNDDFIPDVECLRKGVELTKVIAGK
ncbi:MAG: hypothetical protein KA369_08335 [Spirochaetes bacterium]|nr:hypothetical protein [Spirochaetota bacterium]